MPARLLSWCNDEMRQTFERSPYRHLLDDPAVLGWVSDGQRGSPALAGARFRRLGNACAALKTTPADLARMDERQAVGFLRQLVGECEAREITGVTVKGYVTAVKSWWRFNDIEVRKRVTIRQGAGIYDNERVPTREELQRIIDVSLLREKVAASLMAFCGFRPQVFGDFLGRDGLVLRDLPEMEMSADGRGVRFSKVPTLIRVRRTISKKRNAYFVFAPQQACDYLKNYIEWRIGRGEVLSPESPLLTAAWNYDPCGAIRIRTANIQKTIGRSMRKAGFGWRPYVLRRYFDVRMMEAEADGLIIPDWRAFWMGHAGSMEATYTVNKALPEATIERMREAFGRACEKHLTTSKAEGLTRDAMLATFNRRFLKLARWTDGEIEALGDLSAIGEERLQDLLEQKSMRKLGLNGNTQKVVPMGEVKRFIEDGWEYLSALPSGEAVIRLPLR
jgi:integrase